MSDLSATRATHRLVLAGAVWRHVVVMQVALRCNWRDRIQALCLSDRSECCNAERLRLAAREEPRAVGTWQKSNLNGDRADLIHLSAVNADPLLHREGATGLLMHVAEEVLSEARLATCRFEERLRFALPATCCTDRVADPLLEGGESLWQLCGEEEEQLCCCLCIAPCAVRWGRRYAVDARQVAELE